MTTRADVVAKALSFNGYLDGAGYDVANQFSGDLGRPAEAWCGDFVTDIFKRTGLVLPSMQDGCKTGFAYVPSAWAAAKAKNSTCWSWQAQPGDLAVFDWNGNGVADHVELVEVWANGVLHTVGGNSGPSNVDAFNGPGGVHRHVWDAPENVGNSMIQGIVKSGGFVSFGAPPVATKPAPTVPPAAPRYLMLKSPMMHGADVQALQHALNHSQHEGIAEDGYFGPATAKALLDWQRRFWPNDPRQWDAICGPLTRRSLGI